MNQTPELKDRGLAVFQALVEYQKAQQVLFRLVYPDWVKLSDSGTEIYKMHLEKDAKNIVADSLLGNISPSPVAAPPPSL